MTSGDGFDQGPVNGVPTRAYAQHDHVRRGVAIWVTQSHGGGRVSIGQAVEIVMVDGDEASVVVEPTFRLPEEFARAMLDALAAHFGGVSDVRSLRKDYDAERKRVDRMIDHLTRSVTG